MNVSRVIIFELTLELCGAVVAAATLRPHLTLRFDSLQRRKLCSDIGALVRWPTTKTSVELVTFVAAMQLRGHLRWTAQIDRERGLNLLRTDTGTKLENPFGRLPFRE